MLKGLKAIGGLPAVKRRILVHGGGDSWQADEGIEVMSAARFVAETARGV